jgi:hypothetical protein
MPDEAGWIIQRGAADLTSRSLRTGWMIERCAADATSASLREADATSGSVRRLLKRSPPYIPPHAGEYAISLPACGEGWGGAGLVEGRACHARSEGHACHAR